MRIMINENGTRMEVHEHIILKNFWEYYLTQPASEGVVLCYVMGFENEIGDVSIAEIKPYIMTRTKDLSEVAPPPGWRWED